MLREVETGVRAVVTRHGRPVALLCSVEQVLDLMVREQLGAPPTEFEALRELLGSAIHGRWVSRSIGALEHGRRLESVRAPGLNGDERRRRKMREIYGDMYGAVRERR